MEANQLKTKFSKSPSQNLQIQGKTKYKTSPISTHSNLMFGDHQLRGAKIDQHGDQNLEVKVKGKTQASNNNQNETVWEDFGLEVENAEQQCDGYMQVEDYVENFETIVNEDQFYQQYHQERIQCQLEDEYSIFEYKVRKHKHQQLKYAKQEKQLSLSTQTQSNNSTILNNGFIQHSTILNINLNLTSISVQNSNSKWTNTSQIPHLINILPSPSQFQFQSQSSSSSYSQWQSQCQTEHQISSQNQESEGTEQNQQILEDICPCDDFLCFCELYRAKGRMERIGRIGTMDRLSDCFEAQPQPMEEQEQQHNNLQYGVRKLHIHDYDDYTRIIPKGIIDEPSQSMTKWQSYIERFEICQSMHSNREISELQAILEQFRKNLQ